MGYATLGFPGGASIQFRIDPQSMDWGFQINTSVTNTVGGRVVQVTGATLSDITIQGLFGQDHSQRGDQGDSWRLAVRFASKIRQMMDYQSQMNKASRLVQPAVFSYPPRGWKFRVYIKALSDPDGGVVTHRVEKFSHGYNLVLFIVQSDSDSILKAGEVDGTINKAKQKAINDYIGRISKGIGWKPSIYNGNFGDYFAASFPTANQGGSGG